MRSVQEMQNLLYQANEAMPYRGLRRLFEEFRQTDEQGLTEMSCVSLCHDLRSTVGVRFLRYHWH